MGCADLVPGVSGGTVALILGVYERLIAALGALSRRDTWRALLRGRLREVWFAVDGVFLMSLAAGILTAVATLPILLERLLREQPTAVYAAFFGLIAASVPLVFGRIRRPRPALWWWAAAGASGAFVLVGASPAETPDAAWFLVLSGALGVSALLLPGISGAFILVLLGKYDLVLAALAGRDFAVLGVFALGMAAGLLAFSRLLAYLLARHHDVVMGLLAGVLAGSLRKVWPWQETVGAVRGNVPPPDAGAAASAVLLAVVAGALVVLLQRWGESSDPA